MSCVTSRIQEIRQPYGGYIPLSMFTKTEFFDGNSIYLEEDNLHASVTGMAVDYLTRFMLSGNVRKAFEISIDGYFIRLSKLKKTISDEAVINSGILDHARRPSMEEAKKYLIELDDGENSLIRLLDNIKGIDDKSIISACKAVTYDIWYRCTPRAPYVKQAKDTNPNKFAIQNVRTMVQRSLSFFDKIGPITKDGFSFLEYDEDGSIKHNGYTNTVDFGDGDYLTSDTLWDIKVSKSPPRSSHTLQILMYYLMGKHSGMDIFKDITRIGIFNPRRNTMYTLNVNEIPDSTIRAVENDVICYEH